MPSPVVEFMLEVLSAGSVAGEGRCPAWLRWALRVGIVVLVVVGLIYVVIASVG